MTPLVMHGDSLPDAADVTPAELAVLALVRDALLEVHGAQKAAALELGLLEQELSRQLRGERHLPLTLLARDRRVLEAFAAKLGKHVGLIVRRADEPERRLSRIEQLQAELHARQLELAGLMAQEMSERRLDAAIRHCR